MRAMILAAGRGERLRPQTDTCPKPLLRIGGRELLAWHLEKLAAAGLREIVINSAWLTEQVQEFVGDGRRFGVRVVHSVERPQALETCGGIVQALPHLGDAPFLVINGDIYLGQDYREFAVPLRPGDCGRLYLVPNPDFHPQGDFSLGPDGRLRAGGDLTFSGAAVYAPAFFAGIPPGRRPLREPLKRWLTAGRLAGERLTGAWFNVGTPATWAQADRYLRERG